MKHIWALVLLVALIFTSACKKEEQKPTAEGRKQTAAKGQKKRPGAQNVGLRIFRDKQLVATIPATEYSQIATTKIKVGAKEFEAVLVRDLLQKYNLQAKNVILTGPQRSVTLPWTDITTNDLYVYVGPKKKLLIYSPKPGALSAKLPAQVVRITVSETAKAPARATKTSKKTA